MFQLPKHCHIVLFLCFKLDCFYLSFSHSRHLFGVVLLQKSSAIFLDDLPPSLLSTSLSMSLFIVAHGNFLMIYLSALLTVFNHLGIFYTSRALRMQQLLSVCGMSLLLTFQPLSNEGFIQYIQLIQHVIALKSFDLPTDTRKPMDFLHLILDNQTKQRVSTLMPQRLFFSCFTHPFIPKIWKCEIYDKTFLPFLTVALKRNIPSLKPCARF